jgi:serine/threonine protein kinase
VAGQVIADRFEIERHIGSGGMDVVYRAIDRRSDALVAVKIVRAGDDHASATGRLSLVGGGVCVSSRSRFLGGSARGGSARRTRAERERDRQHSRSS